MQDTLEKAQLQPPAGTLEAEAQRSAPGVRGPSRAAPAESGQQGKAWKTRPQKGGRTDPVLCEMGPYPTWTCITAVALEGAGWRKVPELAPSAVSKARLEGSSPFLKFSAKTKQYKLAL